MKVIFVCLAVYLSMSQIVWPQSVGFKQFAIGENTKRIVNMTLWYPTSSTKPLEVVGENVAFYGTEVIHNGVIEKGRYPLVLLSHGYRGSWRNLNWLAHQLTQQGMVVVAVDHPGTTTFNSQPLAASQWWKRPDDLVRALNFLLSDSQWYAVINQERISAIGHSLGGWSVMQLAGAQFDRQQFLIQCQRYPNPRVCGLANELGLNKKQTNEPVSSNLSDKRINKVVVLDLGLARSFSLSSLTNLKTATLILAAGIDIGDLPQAQESGFLAEHIPLSHRYYQVYEQAMHFSFIQLCKSGAIDLLESESLGDGIICKDGIDNTRQQLHQKMLRDINIFLTP